jgi:hypothetical protein
LSPLLQPSVPLAPRRTRRKEKGRTRARSEPYAPECVEEKFSEVRLKVAPRVTSLLSFAL